MEQSLSSLKLWQISILTPYKGVEGVLELLQNLNIEAVSWYEDETSPLSSEEDDHGFPIAERFIIRGYTKEPPSFDDLRSQLNLLSVLLNIALPHLQPYEFVDQQDWLKICYQSLPSREIGQYYVYGSHNQDIDIPQGLFPLQINAATAFGSGEHQTTSGCLLAISDLYQEQTYTNLLDMGCGSGILAIALAKTWPQAHVLAADNDPEAIRITTLNCQLNDCPQVQVILSEGFSHPVLRQQDPFELIVANILEKPLCQMASMMRQSLKAKGYVILSGLLDRQKEEVLSFYIQEEFDLIKVYLMENWATLLLQLK